MASGWSAATTSCSRAFPSFGDILDLVTFCSGTGPRWAERRTRIASGSAPVAEAVGLWVFADRAGGRPLPLDEEFFAIYGEAAGGRRVQQPARAPPASGRRERRVRGRSARATSTCSTT